MGKFATRLDLRTTTNSFWMVRFLTCFSCNAMQPKVKEWILNYKLIRWEIIIIIIIYRWGFGRRGFVKSLREEGEIEGFHPLSVLFHSLATTLLVCYCCHHFFFLEKRTMATPRIMLCYVNVLFGSYKFVQKMALQLQQCRVSSIDRCIPTSQCLASFPH